MGFFNGPKPPEPPKNQSHWLTGATKTDKHGHALTKKTSVPGGFMGVLGKSHTTTPKQHNSAKSRMGQVARGGGKIDHSWMDGNGNLFLNGHDSHGNDVTYRIEPDGYTVGEIH